MPGMKVKRKSPAVTRVEFQTQLKEPYDLQPFLLISDLHYDSPSCDVDLLKKHLDQAIASNAIILVFGDVFDVMGTYNDPRSKPQSISSTYLSKDFSYLDMVIEDAVEFFKPYARNIALISTGNHETKIQEKHDTDPIRRLVKGLEPENPSIQHGNYTGFVELVERTSTGSSGFSNLTTVHFHHGFGGSAHRSLGVLNVQLECMRYPSADLLVRGHIHRKWHIPDTVQIVPDKAGKLQKKPVDYVQLGAYKDGYEEGQGGFAIEKNLPPSKLGGYWLNYYRIDRRNHKRQIVDAD